MPQNLFRQQVNYPPWIGSSFSSRGNRRILLVGRSYYDARYENKSIQEYIKYLIKTGKEDLFFNALEAIVSERQHWKQSFGKYKLDRKKFWNSVAYHQYLQGILPDSYSLPSRQMWKEAQERYKELLDSLKPDIVLIFHFEVFDKMPTIGGHRGEEYHSDGLVMQTWETGREGSPLYVCRMMNPREGTFRVKTWKEMYTSFLGDYKQKNIGISF